MRGFLFQYGPVYASVTFALIIKLTLLPAYDTYPFLLFFSAIAFSAWWAGTVGGIVATCFAAVYGQIFFLAPGPLLLQNYIVDIVPSFLFLIDGLVISLVCGLLHHVSKRAEELRSQAQAAEHAKDESLAQLNTLLEAAPFGLCFWDTEMRYIRINRMLAQSNNTPPESHIGHTVQEISPSLAEKVKPDFYRVLATRLPVVNQENMHDTSLETCFLTTYYPVVNEQGRMLGVGAIVIDITERKHIEERTARLTAEVERQRLRLDNIIAKIPGIVWETQFINGFEDQRTTFMSDYTETMLGYRPGVYLERPNFWLQVIHPEDRERVIREENTLLTKGSIKAEYRCIAQDESVVWVESHSVLVLSEQGTPVGVRGVTMNISERKEAERLLKTALKKTSDSYHISHRIGSVRTAQEMLDALLTSNELYGIPYASITQFNRPWENDPPEEVEVTAVTSTSESPIPPGERGRLDSYPFHEQLSSRAALLIEDIRTDDHIAEPSRAMMAARGLRSAMLLPLIASGTWFGMLTIASSQPHHWSSEHVDYIQSFVDQIAVSLDNLRLLNAEAKARREAEQADRLKLKFLAMISHELRTPLTSIKGFATTLLADDVEWDSQSQRDFITVINDEADKLTDLIEQLIDLSRLQAGKLTITPESHPMADVISRASAELEVLTSAHNLVIHIPQGLPPLRVDIQRISQVMVNLVGNAAKYSPEGTTIVVFVHAQNDQVRIDIIDEGSGIPLAAREHVFEAFSLVEDRASARLKGAGLGLAICKGLIEAHHGLIWIQDREPPGTTISFTLPLASSHIVEISPSSIPVEDGEF